MISAVRERAALAWTEAVTLVTEGCVPDDPHAHMQRQFGEKEPVDPTMAMVAIDEPGSRWTPSNRKHICVVPAIPNREKGKTVIRIKRAYDPPAENDGERILVDRLWPRGLRKEVARFSSWIKDLGPTTELRKWFGHDPSRWEEFRGRYEKELLPPQKQAILRDLAARSRQGTITLVFGAKDEIRNNAAVLRDLIERAAEESDHRKLQRHTS